MVKVLITGVGGGVGQGIIKSLRLIKDLDIYIVTADMSELASGLYGGDYSYIVPAAHDEYYFDRIKQICAEQEIDFYFPGTDIELLKCAHYSNELKQELKVITIVPPVRVIEIANDKYETINFLKENDFPYPETYLPEEIDWSCISFPIIVKPRVGYRSIGVHLVANINEAQLAIDSLSSPIIQEYISGNEYTCTIAIYNDVISDVLCLRRDLRSGDTFRAFPVKSQVIEKYVKDIAVRLGVSGSCNFQLRINELGEPKLFEINSRFSGTTPFCSYLGFNPVEFCLKTELGLDYKSDIDYDKVILRHWSEVVIEKKEIESLKQNLQGRVSNVKVTSLL